MMPHRDSYFWIIHWILLSLVFIGFAPSFYLKWIVAEQPMYPEGLPVPHMIHGVILTAWYIFLLVQSDNIKSKRIALHKRLGWIGAGLAAMVLLSTIWVVYVFPGRMQSLAKQLNRTVEEIEPGLNTILWLDFFMTALFVAFFAVAILKRRSAEIHKRLIMYTGIVYIFAAVGRIGGTLSYITGMNISLVVILAVLFSLTVSLLIHDWHTRKRVLPVSWICFVLFWAGYLGSFLLG